MKKLSRTLLSMLLCLTVAMSTMLLFPQEADAAYLTPVAGGVLTNGSTITAVNQNSAKSVKCYSTPTPSSYTNFSYHVKVPAAGTLMVQYSDNDSPYFSASGCGATFLTTANHSSGDKIKAFAINTAGTVTISVGVSSNRSVPFAVFYAPASANIGSKTTDFFLGKTGSGAVSTLNVKAPAKGYFEVRVVDGLDPSYSSSYVTTKGFKGWEWLSKTRGYTTYVGVKKGGKYAIKVKGSGGVYNVKVVFHKVKETSNKTTKKKAAKIKKKKANKGIVVAGSKKAHWYKIKQKSNTKMTIKFNSAKMSEGGASSGKLKVTMYFPDGKSQYGYVYPGEKRSFKVTYGRIGTTKARRGTYRLKVQPMNGGNGYYTMTWK